MKKRLAIILAAGKGSRMKSDIYKVLHKLNGQTMVEHILDTLEAARLDRIITIIGHGAEAVKEVVGDRSAFALQREQLGTAHAAQQAQDLLEDETGSTLVINGDTPLLTPETVEAAFAYHEAEQAKATVLTAIISDPFAYGRVIRQGDGSVVKIVEEKDASPEERQIQEVNTGTYIFDNQALFQALKAVDNDNAQGEYYLPDVIEILKNQGHPVAAYTLADEEEALGINDRISLAKASQLMNARIIRRHMAQGVTFVDPGASYVELGVSIGQDTVIEPGVMLKGHSQIGSHCVIGAHSQIIDSQLGDGVVVQQSVIESSALEDGVTVGPFAHLRPGTQLAEGVHIGNFVEVKNARLGARTRAGHLTYVGDGDVGQDVNLGAGTIFVNYDGTHKHRTQIGDESFIGCGSYLIAPLTIGDRVVTAAGSTVYEDVDSESLAIARSRQVNKAQYWKKFKHKEMEE